MPVVGRTQQQDRGVDGPAGHHHDVGGEPNGRAVAQFRDDRGDAAPGGVRLEPAYVGMRDQLDVGVFQGRVHADDLGVRLRADQAGEAVDAVAADAGAPVHCPPLVVLEEVHPDREVEGVQALLLQVVAQLLDARLVLHGRIRVLGAGRPLGEVLAVPPVDEVEVLGLRVVRLQVAVVQRPGGRDAVVVADFAEVLGAHAEERGAVELGVPADVVVHLGREPVSVLVVPELRCAVLPFDEDRRRVPVVPFARQVVAALQKQDPLAGGRQAVGERAAAGACADDDDVVLPGLGHAGHLRGARSAPVG